jgi:hypothetical protein
MRPGSGPRNPQPPQQLPLKPRMNGNAKAPPDAATDMLDLKHNPATLPLYRLEPSAARVKSGRFPRAALAANRRC